MTDKNQPILYIVATPIGNLEDISFRAIRILSEVDAIACEDTRQTRKLLSHYKIKTKQVFSCHDHNEKKSALGIVKLLDQGLSVALCSDAGTPVISDPGFQVIAAVRKTQHSIRIIPGASAVLSALVLSGIAPHEFVFLGFPPRKTGQRKNWLRKAMLHNSTLVIMESPYRLPSFLKDALEILGNVNGSVSIEITKMFESTHTGELSYLVTKFTSPPKGEVMVVIDARANKKIAL